MLNNDAVVLIVYEVEVLLYMLLVVEDHDNLPYALPSHQSFPSHSKQALQKGQPQYYLWHSLRRSTATVRTSSNDQNFFLNESAQSANF